MSVTNSSLADLHAQIETLLNDLSNDELRKLRFEDLAKLLEINGYDDDFHTLYQRVEAEWQRRLVDGRDSNSAKDGDRSEEERTLFENAILDLLPLARKLNASHDQLEQLRNQTPPSRVGSVESAIDALSIGRWTEALQLLADTSGTPEDIESNVQRQRRAKAELLLRNARTALEVGKLSAEERGKVNTNYLEPVLRIGIESQREEARRLMKPFTSRRWLLVAGAVLGLLVVGVCGWVVWAHASPDPLVEPTASAIAAASQHTPEVTVTSQPSPAPASPSSFATDPVLSTATSNPPTPIDTATSVPTEIQPTASTEASLTSTIPPATTAPAGPASLTVQGVRAEYAYTNRVAPDQFGAYTRMRSEPRPESTAVAFLRNGDQVQVLQDANDWYQVRILQNGDGSQVGQEGWIEHWLIDNQRVPEPPSPTPIPSPTKVPTPDNRSLRVIKQSEDDAPGCISFHVAGIPTRGWHLSVDGIRGLEGGAFDGKGDARVCGLAPRQEVTLTIFNANGKVVPGGGGIRSRGSAIMRGVWR